MELTLAVGSFFCGAVPNTCSFMLEIWNPLCYNAREVYPKFPLSP